MTPLASHRPCVREGLEHVIGEAIASAMLLVATNIASIVLAPLSREVIAIELAAKEQEGRD